MLKPEQYEGRDSVSVPRENLKEGIEELKEDILSDEKKKCKNCGYSQKLSRWGIKTKTQKQNKEKTVLILCCPSCETLVDLPIEKPK